MPDLRKDPIVGRWVIVAKSRAKRPHDFDRAPQRRSEIFCPFCEGNERATPAEILAHREHGLPANSRGWSIRVVPNKFPALEIEGDPHSRAEGMYDTMRGVGAHEVIIETPAHLVSVSDLSEEQLAEVYWVYRERLADLKRDSRLVYGMLFKNVGSAAGASLEHTHSQLVVTPIVPISVQEEMAGALQYFQYRGRCIYCDMLDQELATEKRIVLDTPTFTAFCPFASRFPFETWVLPKFHGSHYEQLTRQTAEELGRVMKEVIERIEAALDRPAYNYLVHTAPFDAPPLKHYHWHLEIMPRLTNVAGFEWGTGFYINPVPPEEAAAFLRQVDLRSSIPPSPPEQSTQDRQKGKGMPSHGRSADGHLLG